MKKRYAYLVNWKPRKFLNHAQGWHSGSHAIAWAAITTFVRKVIPRTSNSERGIAVPRFVFYNCLLGAEKTKNNTFMGLLNLFREKTSPRRTFEEGVKDIYEDAVGTAMRQSGGEELIAGVLVYHAIASAYDTLRSDKDLLSVSGLTESEYENFMERICKETLDKYLKSY